MQAAIKTKKTLKRIWDRTGDQGDKQRYKRAKVDARRKVAQVKSRAWDDLYEELESPRGRKSLFQLAKQRNKASKDLTRIKQMKNEQGQVLMVDEEIRKRWQDYFRTLLNEENQRLVASDGIPNLGVTKQVSREEVVQELKKMKVGKAVGPDEIPVEAWLSLGEEGVDKLTQLMNEIWRAEIIPLE